MVKVKVKVKVKDRVMVMFQPYHHTVNRLEVFRASYDRKKAMII